MNKVRFLTKIAMAASVFAALTFTVSCSDSDNTSTWCVWNRADGRQMCFEIGASINGYEMTTEYCDMYDKTETGGSASIENKKPDGCEVLTN